MPIHKKENENNSVQYLQIQKNALSKESAGETQIHIEHEAYLW